MQKQNKEEFLNKELKDFIVNTGWTHKIQICQSDLHESAGNRIRTAKIICAALTSAGLASLILQLLPDYQNLSLLVVFALSLSTTIIELVEKEKDFAKLTEQTRNIANSFWELRTDSESLLNRLKTGEDTEDIRNSLEELKAKRKTLNREILNPSSKAVRTASDKLKKNKDNNYSEDYKIFGLED